MRDMGAPNLRKATRLVIMLAATRAAVISVQAGANTLAAAILAARNGDLLLLEDGSYTGTGTEADAAVAKFANGNNGQDTLVNAGSDTAFHITIRAVNALKAIIDGEGTRRCVFAGYLNENANGEPITEASLTFDGLTFTNPSSGGGGYANEGACLRTLFAAPADNYDVIVQNSHFHDCVSIYWAYANVCSLPFTLVLA